MNSANRPQRNRTHRKWFPSSTLAELLLLCILVGLVLATWLQAKRDLEGPKESLILTMHENQPRAAIYSRAGLRVVDCVTGKTLLNSPRIPHDAAQSESSGSPWHAWPGSNSTFPWTNKFNSGRIVWANGTAFTPNLEVEPGDVFTADGFGREETIAATVTIPDDGYMTGGVWRPLRFTFSEGGNALIFRVRTVERKFEYHIFDLRSGRTTIHQGAQNQYGLTERMVTHGDLIVFGDADGKTIKLINPAVGFVDPAAFPNARAALDQSTYNSPHFPIHAIDEQGRKALLTLLAKDGISLVVEPDVDGKEFTDLQKTKTLWKWDTEPNRSWQSENRLVLWSTRESQPPDESNVWMVESRSPFVRRTAWPFTKDEIVDQMTMEVDVRGMTAQRATRRDSSSEIEREWIYWDFENSRVVKLPEDAQQTRRYGDIIVAQSGDKLVSINLNAGNVVQTISLKHGMRPPLSLAWMIWFGAWWFVKRKSDATDATRQVGFVTAILFSLLMGLSYYFYPQLAWLVSLLLVAALSIGLIVVAISRKASLISLSICGLLTLGFLFSGIQRGFGEYPDDTFGQPGSAATTLFDQLTATCSGSLQDAIDSLFSPWTTPQKLPYQRRT